jgi:hypothetical protein
LSSGSKNLHYWAGGSQLVASAGTAVLGYKRHGDTTDRLRFSGPTAGGKVEFGSGSALDTNLYRAAADQLRTDDKLITAVGLGVGNSAAATALGSVTRKREVFDASGASLGVVPFYDAIT